MTCPEEEAEKIARTFADGLAGFDLPEDVEALTGLLVRISRGDLPPDVRTAAPRPSAWLQREAREGIRSAVPEDARSVYERAVDAAFERARAIVLAAYRP